jgi:hypothetical protein
MKQLALIMTVTGLLLAGCSGEKTEPKAEASVSVDTDKAADKINNALDKAGAEMKKAGTEAKGKLEDAGEAIKRKAEEAKDKLTDDKKKGIDVEVKTK